ncbi:PAAR domain-containing protein [Oxalobacteraceae bacterium OM1]|nr:PAAR domain-containing protein [Oxalobacteraceae bacterium OM1]
MRLIGFIRMGDRAACGGVVCEGSPNDVSHGRPLSFQGAHMACRNPGCVIIEAHPFFTASNGRNVPLHGHITTAGCPLISTLNDVHGWTNESGEPIPLSFVQDDDGEWVAASFAEQTGHRFLVKDSETGRPLANRRFVALVDDAQVEGLTDKQGYAHVEAEAGQSVRIHLPYEAPTGANDQGGI